MIKILSGAVLVIAVLVLVLWSQKDNLVSTYTEEGVQSSQMNQPSEIEPTVLAAKIASSEEFILLDVRSLPEHEEGAIPGAVLIPLDQLDGRYTELPMDKEIILYCRSGRRSQIAAEILMEKGYKRVSNLKGGIRAWYESQPTSGDDESCRLANAC